VREISEQHVCDVAVREVGEQFVFGIDAIVLMFDDALDQEMLICVDEFSHVSTLSSEAANVANREVLDDGQE
jgi:hypothetical protein